MTTSAMRGQSARARATKSRLIEAARDVIRASGGASPEAIAAHGGVAAATFYAHFGGKDAVIAAAFDAVLAEMEESLEETLRIDHLLDTDLPTVVHEVSRRVIATFVHDARVIRLAISRLPESGEVRSAYRRRQAAMLGTLENFVRRGMAAGRLRPGDPEVRAQALLVATQALQNPLVLRTGAHELHRELELMLIRLLEPS